MTEDRHLAPPPIHPLAALATLVLDGFFLVFEIFDPFILLFTSLGLGFLGLITTTLVQHYVAKEEWGPSVAKGFVMGIVAGVPYAVAGTVVGVPLLVWAGVSQWVKLPSRGNAQIVDATFSEQSALEDKEKEA
jgi:hypothetical protein